MSAATTDQLSTSPELREAGFEDYSRIRSLEERHLPATLPEDRWRRLYLENPVWPAVGSDWPLGWVLEHAGRIVASVGNVPSRYVLDGEELLCANGRSWVAAAEYRGYAPMVMDEYFSQMTPDLFLNTTVMPSAAITIGAMSEPVPVGDWQTLSFRIARHRRFTRKVLEAKRVPGGPFWVVPAAAALWVRDWVSSPVAPPIRRGDLETSAHDGYFDDRFDGFWQEQVARNPGTLLAVRDATTLRWHYEELRRSGRLRLITVSRNGLLRGYCVLRPNLHPEQGISALRLLDYQSIEPDGDVLPALLAEALRCCRAERLDVLEHLGSGLPRLRAFDRFATHRVRKENWPYFVHVPDPALRARLASPDVWDPSEYDGDASLM